MNTISKYLSSIPFRISMPCCAILGTLILMAYSANLISRIINPPELVREFEERGYTIKELYYPFSRDCDEYGHQFQISLNGKILVESRIWQFMGMWDFCYNSREESPECYLRDINGDSISEIIFAYGSGGNDGREDLEIYSIDSTAREIGFFDGLGKSCGLYWLTDLDNDSVSEICTHSRHYECWKHGCAGSPAPRLVWKWDGARYRLANKKLAELILRKLDKIDPDTIVSAYASHEGDVLGQRYDPRDEDTYPLELFITMLDLIYVGRTGVADSILEYSWPDSIPFKNEFYKEAWDKIEDDPFWLEIENSSW